MGDNREEVLPVNRPLVRIRAEMGCVIIRAKQFDRVLVVFSVYQAVIITREVRAGASAESMVYKFGKNRFPTRHQLR